MKCPSCGQESNNSTRTCVFCGAKMPLQKKKVNWLILAIAFLSVMILGLVLFLAFGGMSKETTATVPPGDSPSPAAAETDPRAEPPGDSPSPAAAETDPRTVGEDIVQVYPGTRYALGQNSRGELSVLYAKDAAGWIYELVEEANRRRDAQGPAVTVLCEALAAAVQFSKGGILIGSEEGIRSLNWPELDQLCFADANASFCLVGLAKDGALYYHRSNRGVVVSAGEPALLGVSRLLAGEGYGDYTDNSTNRAFLILQDGSTGRLGWNGDFKALDFPENTVQVCSSFYCDVFRTADGRVKLIWNHYGSLDSGAAAELESWTDITDVKLYAGYTKCHVIGLRSDGTARCVELHRGKAPDVSTWSNVTKVMVMSQWNGAFGLTADGHVLCAHEQYAKEFGVDDWENVVDLQVNEDGLVGLRADGTLLVSTFWGFSHDVNAGDWTRVKAIYLSPGDGSGALLGLRTDGTVYVSDYSEEVW